MLLINYFGRKPLYGPEMEPESDIAMDGGESYGGMQEPGMEMDQIPEQTYGGEPAYNPPQQDIPSYSPQVYNEPAPNYDGAPAITDRITDAPVYDAPAMDAPAPVQQQEDPYAGTGGPYMGSTDQGGPPPIMEGNGGYSDVPPVMQPINAPTPVIQASPEIAVDYGTRDGGLGSFDESRGTTRPVGTLPSNAFQPGGMFGTGRARTLAPRAAQAAPAATLGGSLAGTGITHTDESGWTDPYPSAEGTPGPTPTAGVSNRPIPREPQGYLDNEMIRGGEEGQAFGNEYAAGRGKVVGRIANVGAYRPTELMGFDSELEGLGDDPDLEQYGQGLEDFDPGAAFDQYLTSSQGRFRQQLDDALERERDSAAERGRINTGFFDADMGETGRRLTTEFTAQAGDRALAAAEASGRYRLNRANTRGDLAARQRALSLDRAGAIDSNRLSRARDIDTMRQRAGESALDAEMRLSTEVGDRAERLREYGSEIASGNLDREIARRNAERQATNDAWQTGIDAVGTAADVYDTIRGDGGDGEGDGEEGGDGGGGVVGGIVSGARRLAGRVPWGTVGKFAAKGLGAAAAGYAGYKYGAPQLAKAGDWADKRLGTRGIGRAAGEIGRGAAIGAAAGSVVPVVGTVLGGAVGAGIGAAASVGRGVKRAGRWLKKRFSDVGLKHDVRPTGEYLGDFPLYSYTIFDKPETGVLAQEVRALAPGAVEETPDGLMVDYARL